METKTLSERIAELNEIKKSYEFEPTALCLKFDLEKKLLSKADNEFFKAMKVIGELQAELEVSQKMYQGALDFSTRKEAENQALLAKNGELQAENKSWQEMVDSTIDAAQNLVDALKAEKV